MTATLFSGATDFGEVYAIGIGPEDLRLRDWEDFGARAAGLAKLSGAERVSVMAPGASAEELAAERHLHEHIGLRLAVRLMLRVCRRRAPALGRCSRRTVNGAHRACETRRKCIAAV